MVILDCISPLSNLWFQRYKRVPSEQYSLFAILPFIPHISHNHHNRRWRTFPSAGVPFPTENGEGPFLKKRVCSENITHKIPYTPNKNLVRLLKYQIRQPKYQVRQQKSWLFYREAILLANLRTSWRTFCRPQKIMVAYQK